MGIKNRALAAPLLLSVMGLAACGGSSNSDNNNTTNTDGTVEALKMPTTLSVLAADQSATAAAPAVRAYPTNFSGASRAISTTTFASDSDFVTDKTRTYVYDSSMESLRTVNMILCLMDQTEADAMLNKGAYIALVDEGKCEQGKNQSGASAGGQSSSAQTVVYNKWTVDSTRASNTDPQIVRIWVPGAPPNPKDPFQSQNIVVEVTISEGVSDTKPYGSFVLNYAGSMDAGLIGGTPGNVVSAMRGTLQTVNNADGKPQFQFIEQSGDLAGQMSINRGRENRANVAMDDTSGKTGKARTYMNEYFDDGSGSSTNHIRAHALHFNTDYARKALPNGMEICLNRKQYLTQVWNYNLYDNANGQRVAMNSGFPFTYDTGANGKVYGHVGYWGIWAENDTTIPDGATIVQQDFRSNTTTNHVVHISPGKLVKRTANTESVPKLQGVDLYYWGPDPTGATTNQGQYLATVDNQNNFIATHAIQWSDSGRTETPLAAGGTGYQATPVAGYNITPTTTGQGLWLWSDTLNGNVTYIHDAAITDAASRTVTFYAQQVIRADDAMFAGGGTLNINCYDRCLQGGITQAMIGTSITAESQLYYPTVDTNAGTPGWQGYVYKITSSGGKVVVLDHTDKIVTLDGVDLTALGNTWGNASTGEMITGAVSNGPWEVYGAPVSYRWETGSNSWNRMVMVENAATQALATFDKPMEFKYVHSTADDRNGNSAFDGKKLLLQYGGDGQLWGFPWKQADPNDPNSWFSPVTLKNGVILNDGSKDYVVKAIEQQQTMRLANPGNPADLSACSSLNAAALLTDTAFTLPTAVSGTPSFAWTDKPQPATTNPIPAVIGGKVQ